MSNSARTVGHVSGPAANTSASSGGSVESVSNSIGSPFEAPVIANELELGILFSEGVKDNLGRTSELTKKTINMIKEIDAWITEATDGDMNKYHDFVSNIKKEFNITKDMNSYKKLDKFYSYMKMNMVVSKKNPLMRLLYAQ